MRLLDPGGGGRHRRALIDGTATAPASDGRAGYPPSQDDTSIWPASGPVTVRGPSGGKNR